ncbi:Uncharacterized protein FKW44_005260, partial [Caligus rogercresseyi]
KTLNETIPPVISLGMFELHCEDLIASIYRKITVLKDVILKKMSKDHQDQNNSLCKRYEEISKTALTAPNNTEELVTLKAQVDHIKSVIMLEMEKCLNEAAQRLIFLSDYMQFTTAEMKSNTRTFQWQAGMPKVFEEHEEIMGGKTCEYQKALKLRRERFIDELESANQLVDDFFSYGDVNELAKYMKKALGLSEKLRLFKEKTDKFNMEEKAFDWELTHYPLLQATMDKLNPFYRLYETSMEFMNKQKTWYECPMGTHDPADIEREVESSWKLVSQLETEFSDIPAAKDLVVNVCEKISEFKDKMPIIKTLGNLGFRDRHWEIVSNTVGFPVSGGSNLFEVLDMGLDEFVHKFGKISDAATKEFNLEKSMKKMVEEWSDMEFSIIPYGDTFTLSSTDGIQVLLDDHIVKTQTMRGSPYIKPFEEQIGKWEDRLLVLQEIMDEWLKVQGIWLYLEPIFSYPDIMAQMPEEGRRFTTVDKNWRDIMKAATLDKHVLVVVEIDRILEKLKKSNELLDLIGKGLNDYLERKRLCFPRFFFLSNSELLEILSETKDPTRVKPHLKKCFEGIASLDFDSDLEVTTIKSEFGEFIPLIKAISTIKARGQVDKWLVELEIQMKESLKAEMIKAVNNYTVENIVAHLDEFPSQGLSVANYVLWTAGVHKAISNNSLKDLYAQNEDFIGKLASIILSHGNTDTKSSNKENILKNILLTQGYFRGILEDVIENDGGSEDFSWLSRLRYYFINNDIELQMGYSKIKYGYEYLSKHSKLVMIPLTEKCYRILLMALDLHQGGIVSGETATGKTETVKDLARAVAKQCVGFNCSEDIHYKAFAKFLKGLASCGAWSCFDEFDRIQTQVLSVMAQQIRTIQRSIHLNQTAIHFEGLDIKINPQCAIFVTTNSLSSSDTSIPHNVRSLFRPIAMASPDGALIAELTLLSQGFKETKTVSKKIASMVELCDGLLSSQPHYEFGLRSFISILRSAGALKKLNPNEDENAIICKAIHTVKYCELLPQDQEIFKSILSHLFGIYPSDPIPDDVLKKAIIKQCEDQNLESTPYFLSKVQQLYDMMDLSDGVMLLGGSFAGKTEACQVLAKSLASVTGKSPTTVVVNPKAIQIDQMYGYFDNDEWVDGILAKYFRQFAALPLNERKWLVFDGPIDSSWIENMNTVLDENKKLCLMSGEMIRLPPNTNLIFEAQDVETAAPATISRCGVLYMDPQVLDWNLIVKNWIMKFPSFITDNVKPSLKIARRHSNIKTLDHHLIQSLINIFDCYLNPLIENSSLKGKSDNELIPMFEGMFYFSTIWSIGGICHEEGKKTFDSHLIENGGSLNANAGWEPSFPIPKEDSKSVFDYKLIIGTKPEWQRWELEASNTSLPRDIYACQLIISTCETVKYNHLMNLLVDNSKPFIFIGASGTGKSSYIKNMLHHRLDPDRFSHTELYFTSVSSPTVTQSLIMSKLDKRRKGVYGPALGKKFLVFVDDINSPSVDEVGSQPPIELLRQLIDRKVWYDLKELSPIKLVDMVILGAMRVPVGGVQGLPSRFFRHFNTIHVNLFSDETIRSIFSRIVLWHLDTKGFSKEFDPCINQLINATLGVHKFVIKELLPTLKDSHYLFSLKEFSRVICGVLLSVPETMTDLSSMKRLWVHEILRVYYDRIVQEEDRELFLGCVRNETNRNLKVEFDDLFHELKPSGSSQIMEKDLRKLMFCDFGDSKNYEEDKFYKPVDDIQQIREVSEGLLQKYNQVSRKPMDLVLFDFAIEHLCRISRVMKQPESHMILIGLGGSGRQSLSRLAAHISGYEFHQIELGKDDELPKWKSELKSVLKKTSLSIEPSVLFLYDSQIVMDEYLEDINNILLSGEVPNIFSLDEKLEIVENMKTLEKQMDKSCHTNGSLPALFSLFVKRIKENMHIIFAMSPTSKSFRRNLVSFPALMDRCTINWFHQWPNDALNFVSNKCLMDIDFRPGEMTSCVSLCEFFHNSTIRLSRKMAGKIFNYVTPASYLELNMLFKKLLREHRKKYVRLRKSMSQVSIMQAEMNAIQPNLAIASKDVDEVLSEQDKVLKSEESIVNEKKKLADTIRNDCESELAEVSSFVEAALEMISSLLKSPTISLRLTTEALCFLKNIKADRVPDPTGATTKMVEDFWGPTKRLLGDPKFLESFQEFDKDNLNPKVMKPDMNPDKSKSTVTAADLLCRAIYRWIQSLDMYEKVARNIAPKRETLAKADSDFQESLEILTSKKEVLRVAQEKLKVIMNDLQDKKQRKAELENEVELCSRKLERAEQLITGFGNERENWSNKAQSLSSKYFQLTGDILLSVGVIAYLGPFPQEVRDDEIEIWKKKAKELQITFSDDFSLQKMLGDPILIQTWYMNGLLQDKDIANRWVKSMEKQNNLHVIKQSDKDFLRTLESCIQFGSPVLLENVGDTLDPVLEPLLQKQTFKQGGSVCIKLGESTIEYSKSFKMYITTRYNNPDFPPEISSKISLINFSITTNGLIDQLLGVIIARERPELEEERSQVVIQINENHKNIIDIQNKILDILYRSKGNILEDENAIKTLSSSKILANEITEKQSTSQSNKERIEENRNDYLDLAIYAVTLFFTSISLSNVNVMYQFSSTWFVSIFCTSIDLADKSDELQERLINIKNHFLKNLYVNTSRGLFEEDKLLYSFLLAVDLHVDPRFKESKIWNDFLANESTRSLEGISGVSSEYQNRLSMLCGTIDLCNEDLRAEDLDFFQSIWTHEDPCELAYSRYKEDAFKALTVTSTLRPDKVLSAIRKYVHKLFDSTFISQEQIDIGKSYSESTHATPIIFILGDFSMGYGGKRLRVISMGKGLEETAEEVIKDSIQRGSWVVLLNCHLNIYVKVLIKKAQIRISDFGFLLVPLSVKIALEELSTLKSNMIRSLVSNNELKKLFESSSDLYKKLVFLLTIIHGVINERRTYDQCGWSEKYIFGEQDFELCQTHLNSVFKSSNTMNESALGILRYLMSACSYGGRMEDEWDQKILDAIIEDILGNDVLQSEDYKIDPRGIYNMQHLIDFKSLHEYLMNLPTETCHDILRMGEATHWSKNVGKGKAFLNKLRLTQKFDEGNDGGTSEREDLFIQVRETLAGILSSLPEEFKTNESYNFSEDKILDIVLDQELQKYNTLLQIMRSTLESAIMCIDGSGILTSDISELLEEIEEDAVPSVWSEYTYPSLEGLSGFLEDLNLRTKFLRDWHCNGPPSVYWLTALFEPGDFLIAILYLHSLKTGVDFHELTLEVKFDDVSNEGILVKDLYLVGANWDPERSIIVESDRQNIYCKLPTIRLVPLGSTYVNEDQNKANIPMFQNSDKSGDENFVIDLDLPSEKSEEEWRLKGVAILCQKPLD